MTLLKPRDSNAALPHRVVTLFLLAIVTISSVVAVQGWRERLFDVDDYLPLMDAYRLVHSGAIPVQGTLSSFMAYIPPGTTWFWALGALFTTNPQTVELYGSILLNAAAIVSVYGLARILFSNAWLGLAAAAAYSVSPLGQRFAVSLWPRGHPFFSCAAVLCVVLWVMKKQSWYLAGAIVLLGAGCYYFLELAPACIILVIAALVFRPPAGRMSLVTAVTVVALIWAPYLLWDSHHGFANLTSSIGRKSLVNLSDSRIAWCDNSVAFVSAGPSGATKPFHFTPADYYTEQEKIPDSAVIEFAKRIAKDFMMKIVRGFSANFTEGMILPFACAFLAGVVIRSIWLSLRSLFSPTVSPISFRYYTLSVLAVGGLTIVLLLATYRVARSNPASENLALQTFITNAVLTACICAGALVDWMLRFHEPGEPVSSWYRICGACIAPAMVMVLITERGHIERLWWLWPLEIILLFAAAADMSKSRPSAGAAMSLLIVIVLGANVSNATRLGDLRANGFAGRENSLAVLLSRAVSLSEPGRPLTIGYQYPFLRFEPVFSAKDQRFRAGMEANLYLNLQHGISNANHCAEGISSYDSFRIVETKPRIPPGSNLIMVASPITGFAKVECDGSLCLYKRL